MRTDEEMAEDIRQEAEHWGTHKGGNCLFVLLALLLAGASLPLWRLLG